MLWATGEVYPPIPRWSIDIGVVTLCECCVGELHSPGSQLSLDADHLSDLITAVDGLATAPTSHLVVRLGSDAPLTHIRDLLDGVVAESHVQLVGTVVTVCCYIINHPEEKVINFF